MITLYQFPHSHFSEKVRWALTFKGLSFQIVNLPRGKHTKITKIFGLPETTVPFIKDDESFVQGSSAILDYLDSAHPDNPLMPADADTRRKIMEFEAYLDNAVGHHGRRYIYSVLVKHPARLKELFMGSATPLMRLAFPLVFPKIRKLLVQKLDLTEDATAQSLKILEGAFAKLNHQLDGREFLFGDQMSRADITAAALTAIFTWPPEHEFDFEGQGTLPQEVAEFRAGLSGQRFYGWGRDMYRMGRH